MPLLFTTTAKADSGTIQDLLRVTSYAILEVFLLCLVGYILGKRGTVDSKTKRTLNKLNQNLFTPALLFGKVAFTLTPHKLKDLWIVPVGFVIVSVVSALLAYALGFVMRISRSQRAFAVACATFMNSNSLPIALMQSLTYTVEGLKWGKDDEREAMLGRALSYLVLFSTLGIILRWSYGISLLSTADAAEDTKEEFGDREMGRQDVDDGTLIEGEQGHDTDAPLLQSEIGNSDERTSRLSQRSPRFSEGPVTIARPPSLTRDGAHRPVIPTRRWTTLGTNRDMDDAEIFHRSLQATRQRQFKKEISNFRSFPNTPSYTPATSTLGSVSSDSGDETDTEDEDEHAVEDDDDEHFQIGMGRRARTEPSRSAWQSSLRRNSRKCSAWFTRWIWKPFVNFMRGVQAFMTAPLYAALLSLIVACIRPLQALLDDMLPLRNAIKSAGNCSVPITLIVLGSYFVEEATQPSEPSKASKTKSSFKKRASKPKSKGVWESTKESMEGLVSCFKRSPAPDKDEVVYKDKAKKGENRTVFVSVVSRMILAPIVLIPLLWIWSIKTSNVADDPVFIVTATLVIGSAPAITLAQMTTASAANSEGGASPFERLISKTLFVSYVFMTFPSTIILVLLGLEIAKRQ